MLPKKSHSTTNKMFLPFHKIPCAKRLDKFWWIHHPEEFGQFGTMILTQLSILHSCGRLLVITGDFYGILHPSTYMYLSHLITGITRAITASFTISKKRPDVHLGPKVPKVEAGLRTMEPG